MSLWRKHAIGFWSHPKVLAAGWRAAVVFCAVLDLNADLARDGQLLARDARPEALLAYATILTPRGIRDGLAKCVEVELLAGTEDGGVRILGWADEWRPRRIDPDPDPDPDSVTDDGLVVCSRCGAQHAEVEFRRCAECRRKVADAASRRRQSVATMSPRCRQSTEATRRQMSPVDNGDSRHDVASLSPDLNGYRSGMLSPEEERREDQSRQELVDECLNECSPSRVLGEDQKASGTQDTGAREGAESARIQRVVDTLSARFCAGEGR